MATVMCPAPESKTVSTPTKLLINNQWVDSESGKTFPTFNPATGEEIARVAEAGAGRRGTKRSPRHGLPLSAVRGARHLPPNAVD